MKNRRVLYRYIIKSKQTKRKGVFGVNKIKVSKHSRDMMRDARKNVKDAKKKRDEAWSKVTGGQKFLRAFKVLTIRMLEVFADTMVGFAFVIGVGANGLPYLATTLANDAGVVQMINMINANDMQGVITTVANLLVVWGFPMMFVSVGLGYVCMKLLIMCVKKIHNGCNNILAKPGSDSDEED